MPGQHDKVMPETSGDDGSTSGSEVSIGEEGDDSNRNTADSDDSDEEETESSDEDESLESDTSDSGDDSSSDGSDSSDSLWGAFDDDDKKETQEANEASALQEFQRALDYLLKGKSATASKILNKLLNNPLVKCFHTKFFDWEAEVDERLSKMARLYVGIHKNLAKLDTDNATEHFLQILSVAPKNSDVWLSLGVDCINKGDVDFAKFAFEHAEGNDATDSLLSALYLSRNYHACLRLTHKCLNVGLCEQKALFLKERIRSINSHYSEFCDSVFGENRRYSNIKMLDEKTTRKIAKRLAAVETVINSVGEEPIPAPPSPIDLTFDADQTASDVATVFCDLFDRIEAYSSLSLQQMTFSRWDDRRDLIESTAVLEDIIDVVDTVHLIVNQVSSLSGKSRSQLNSCTLLPGSSDCFLRRSMRNAMELPFEDDELSENPDGSTTFHLDGNLPTVELAETFGFGVKYVPPLKNDIADKTSRTPTPGICPKYADTDELLCLLRTSLKEGSWTIFELLDTFLCLLADFCPTFGVIPTCLLNVAVQCYRRFNLLSSDLCDDRYIRLHVLMDELGEPHARDYCIRWHCAEKWNCRELVMRFAWSHAKAVTDEDIRLSFLRFLYNYIDDDEFVFTAKGWFGKEDVRTFIHKLEKSSRIVSISQLRSCSRYEEVIAIITRDVDLSSMDGDDLLDMVEYLMDAYCKVKNYDSAMGFASRVLHLLFSYKQLPHTRVTSLLNFIYNTDWSQVTKQNCEEIGYFLCRLTYVENYGADWNTWRELYRIVKRLKGDVSVEYIQSLDPLKHDDCLPSKALDVLVKAHEKLGEAKTCGCDKGAFLLFFMEQLYTCISNENVMSVLQQERYAWVWFNVSEEISQCLYCMLGRYSKRRRALEDHECSISSFELETHSKMILELAMPHPLPQYDDKERLGHDVVDLLLNKFPSLLKCSKERWNVVERFNKWMCDAAREDANNRLQWPSVGDESYLQACIWYLMALHHYRQSNHDEIEKYSKLFLTSGYATLESRITAGAWAVLAYTSVYRIFQMDDDLLYLEWTWHVLPFRISLLIDNKIGVVFFQLASTLYQIATRLSRYFLTLPSDDWRLRRAQTLLNGLRSASLSLFEEALAQTHGEASGICEYQWLGYFFIAKLHAKLNVNDVIKVLDGLYEAACSCELSDFFYPIKINTKKQQNIEPVELHYQIHATVWKYLCRTPSPPLNVLVSLLAYLRTMQSHKVVRSNLSLFTSHPEIHETVINLTINCEENIEEDDVAIVVSDLITRVDVLDEIWNLCHRGFELVCDRFPHMKSYYRLAEMELSRGNAEAAYSHLTKHIFRRKKREDSLFDNVVEITSQDIDRSGSFPYHVERALQLTMSLAYQFKDIPLIISVIITLVGNVESRSEEFILKERQRALLVHAVSRLHILAVESGSPKQLRNEMYRAWQIVSRCKSLVVRSVQAQLQILIQCLFGSVDNFVAEQLVVEDNKKKQVRKRKLTSYDLSSSQQRPILLVHGSAPFDHIAATDGDPSKLMRLALQSR